MTVPFWPDRRVAMSRRAVAYIEHRISWVERAMHCLEEDSDAFGLSPSEDEELANLKRDHAELCIVLAELPKHKAAAPVVIDGEVW